MKKLTQAVINRARPRAKPYDIGGSGLVLRVEPTGRKTFYVITGRHKRTRIGTVDVITLARAQYVARAKLNEAAEFGDVLKLNPRKSSLGAFIAHDYEPWLRANRRRPDRTLAGLKRNFESRLYAKRLTDITRSDLDSYVAARRADGCAAATIVRDLNNLQSVLRLALEHGYLRVHPFRGWRKPKVEDNGVTRHLSTEEEIALRGALAERDDKARRERVSANDWRREREHDPLPEWSEKEFTDHISPMTLVSLNTGIRFGELTALEWSSVDFRARVLTVRAATAKGAKTRHVPLNAEALDVLTRWKAQCDGKGLVFTNGAGTRIGSVKSAWLALLKSAKIENFRWHDMRHSFASRLVQKGVDLVVVRDLLGHSDFSLTLRYAHLVPKQKADAVERLVT